MSAPELLERVASRFWRAMEAALPSLPQSLRAALAWRVEDGDMRWALSLMLAGWRLSDPREPRAGDILQLFKQLGVAGILGQINHLRGLDGFVLFADYARDAETEAKRKAAAVALRSAIERLDALQLSLLIGLLRRPEVREAGQVLIRRFPTPGSARPPVWGAPPEKPDAGSSRGELFDRADFAPRERALRRATTSPPPPRNVVAEEESAAPPPVPAPALDDHAMTVAFLHTLGHSEAEIARLMAGPPKKL
jgi:hypothetical protein